MDETDLIKEKINIVDLIQEYLPLKKTGINFKANCPFHSEKTPSFIVSPERQIFKCFGCFPPGQKIKTPFGYHNIEELDEEHYVISGQGLIRKILATHKRNYTGELVDVKVRKFGGIVSLTSDHQLKIIRPKTRYFKKTKQFYRRVRKYIEDHDDSLETTRKAIHKYGNILEVSAGELEKYDFVLYPISKQITDIEEIDLNSYLTKRYTHGKKPPKITSKIRVDDSLLKLLGYYIAEGSNNRAYIRFSLGNHEEDFAQEIIRLIRKIFNLEAKIHRRTGKKTGIEITACHSYLANIFENLCGKGAAEKHIPFVFQELPPAKQMILVQAIFKGDGSSYVADNSSKRHFAITVISRIMIEQIVDILLRNNIFPSYYLHPSKISQGGVNHKQSYGVFWSEEARPKHSLLYKDNNESLFWLLPIKQLNKRFYTGPVYNLTIEEDHSYVATNFAVLNCGKSGDIFTFLMEKEGMDFKEALEVLAKRAGVVLKKGDRQQATGYRERLFEVNLKSQEFFHYILTKHKLGKKALEYLRNRGISSASIEEFGLGYAPNSWESLTAFLLKRGFKIGEVVASGVAVPSRSGGYDRFRGRISFPLIDGQGKLRGFSGRVLYPAEPKYINTPQTPIFDKSKFLFGINLAKAEIRNKNEAVLVEGEMDVILSYQAGFKNVVACKGTALTEGQIDLLKKYTENLSLSFDMDLAGDSASRRGIEMADKAGLNIKVIELTGGKDAAEVIKENPKEWQKAIEQAVPIYDYYLSSTAKRYDVKKAADLKKIGEELIPVWAKISDDLERDRYIQKLAAFLKTDEGVLREAVEKTRTTPPQNYTAILHQPVRQDNVVGARSRRELLEDYLIALLLHPPKDFVFVPGFPETLFLKESFRQIYVLLVLYLDSISFKVKQFNINEFVANLPKELLTEVDRLYLTELDPKLTDEKRWQKEVDGVISELKKALIKASLEKLSYEIKNAQEFGKMEMVETLNKRFRDLSVKLKNL